MSRLVGLLPNVTMAALILTLCPAQAEPIGPLLGAATNFSHGSQPHTLSFTRQMGITHLRDGMNWSRAETRPRQYDFAEQRLAYPDYLTWGQDDLTVVVNWGNPLYDQGNTPQSPDALAAVQAYTQALVERFPVIGTIEVGNELNGVNFVRGPMKQMTPTDRALAYVPMLQAVSKGARAGREEIRVLGGATHSLPGGWLWTIMDAGGAQWMDAVAIHPYTTPAEQFVRQMAVLRRHPDLASMEFEVTEFGTQDAGKAASHLLRNYCQFALAGVQKATWFPANLRGEATLPLFTPKGRKTTAGFAYQLVAQRMEGRPVKDVSDDDFTYGCQFGEDTWVLWGAPRPITVAQDAIVLDATGSQIPAPTTLRPETPIVIVAPNGASVPPVILGPQPFLADSYYQFAYPQEDELKALGDGFERFARKGERTIALRSLPGQERPGVPWVPWRGNSRHKGLRLTAETLLPDRGKDIVHRYTAPQAETVTLSAQFRPSPRSKDGVVVTLFLNGSPFLQETATGQSPLDIQRSDLTLAKGDLLEIVVGAGQTSKGDLTRYRIRLRQGTPP